MIAKSKKVLEEEIELLPCCECGSTELELFNSGYSSFNVVGVECKKCDNKMHINGVDWNMFDTDIVKSWNKENDLDTNIAKVERSISNLQRRVKKLKKLKNAHKT